MNYSLLLTTLIVFPSWGEQLEDFPVSFVATETDCGQSSSRETVSFQSWLGEGNGAPLQYTCLENPMDEAWWATVHGVAKSQIQLSNFASHHSVVSKSLNVKYVDLHICCLVSFTFHISSTFYLLISVLFHPSSSTISFTS